MAAHTGQSLFVGDRVITRGSKASVAMSGCSVALTPTSILTVSSAPCAQPQSFAAAQDGTTEGAGATGGGLSGTQIGLIVLAVGAVGGGVAAATSNSSTRPTSP